MREFSVPDPELPMPVLALESMVLPLPLLPMRPVVELDCVPIELSFLLSDWRVGVPVDVSLLVTDGVLLVCAYAKPSPPMTVATASSLGMVVKIFIGGSKNRDLQRNVAEDSTTTYGMASVLRVPYVGTRRTTTYRHYRWVNSHEKTQVQ